MFFQRYVHVVLDAVLGAYVKNIDPDALRISVWNGKIEVDALELQPDAFPLPAQLELVKGTLHKLRIDLPWANLANEPIRVDIEAISLLLRVVDGGRGSAPQSAEELEAEAKRAAKLRLQTLQRKRATLDAYEKASELNEENARQEQTGWTQSFLAKLLIKALDNLQVQVQHLHVRMEDACSSETHPYAVGVTLESLIIKSADEGWNYTMVVRSAAAAAAKSGTPDNANPVAASFLRKKMDINKFGVYWTMALEPVSLHAIDDNHEFARVMQQNFFVDAAATADSVPTPPSSSSSATSSYLSLPSPPPSSSSQSRSQPLLLPPTAQPTPPSSATTNGEGEPAFPMIFYHRDYLIQPLTVSMKLTINDGNAKLPLTHQELSQRVLSRLGTPWLVDTIDAIGDDAWREFVGSMPRLAGGRKYTLGFVFSEAWSVARDLVEEEDAIPSLEQFKQALASCLQWSPRQVDRVSACVERYREAVVHVMDEKSTYIDALATVDDITISLRRQQYLSALSLISFLTVKKRQARYLKLRPSRSTVHDDPRAWWRYATGAVLLDVRERLARVDWEEVRRVQDQHQRYRELYALSTLGPLAATNNNTVATMSAVLARLVSPDVITLPKEAVSAQLDELEVASDVQDLVKLRHGVKKEIARLKVQYEAETKKKEADFKLSTSSTEAADTSVPASSRLWAYASWFVPGVGGATAAPTGAPSWTPQEPPPSMSGSGQDEASSKIGSDGARSEPGSTASEPPDVEATTESLATTAGSLTALVADDVKWSDQDTKELYDAIDFHPGKNDDQISFENDDDGDDSESRSSIPSDSGNETPTTDMTPRRRHKQMRKLQTERHIWYRFQLQLSKVGFALSLEDVPLARNSASFRPDEESTMSQRIATSSAYLIAAFDDAQIQFLVRPSSVEMGLQLGDAYFSQHKSPSIWGDTGKLGRRSRRTQRRISVNTTDFFLERMGMDEILQYHPVDTQKQMSSVRLRECERELPLISLSVEAERPQDDLLMDDDDTESDRNPSKLRLRTSSVSPTTPSSVLRISLVTQAIKCNANLLFLLDVVSVFSRPVNVDLSGIEQTAWKRAQSLQRYSAAQLNDALARRTKIELRLDVISPLINVVESPSLGLSTGPVPGKEVSLLVFLGHLQAATKHPLESASSKSENSLYDTLEFSISGIEVQILENSRDSHPFFAITPAPRSSTNLSSPRRIAESSWRHLLEKTSLTFSFHTSVAPDDPGIPLLKLFGGVESVHLNLSASSFRALTKLLSSFGSDFAAHAQRRLAMDASRGVATTLMHVIGDSASFYGDQVGNQASSTPSQGLRRALSSRRDSVIFGTEVSGGSSSRSLSFKQRLELLGGSNEGSEYSDDQSETHEEPLKPDTGRKDADDADLLKLWKRVICHLEFVVGDVTVKLQLGEATDIPGKIVRARAADIRTHLTVRSFDRRLEFALGTFSLEELLFAVANPMPEDVDGGRHASLRYLMKSGSRSDSNPNDEGSRGEQNDTQESEVKIPTTKEQLIDVVITSIASDAVLPKDRQLWKDISHGRTSNAGAYSIWQDTLVTPLSVDVNLQVLTINIYQATFAEIIVFFFRRDDENKMGKAAVNPPQTGNHHSMQTHAVHAGTTLQDLVANDETKVEHDLLSVEPDEVWGSPQSSTTQESGTFSKKIGAWMSTSFLDNMSGPDKDVFGNLSEENGEVENEEDASILPASLQLRIHVDGLSLYMHLENPENQRPSDRLSSESSSTSNLFAVLTAQRFCCSMQRFPRFFSIYAYLTSLKICDSSFSDKNLREIISHGDSPGGFAAASLGVSPAPVGHIPTIEEILDTIDRVPAVFSCAAQFYGADNIQQSWHPGYSSRYSVRLKAPRIRFLYSFIDDMRNYLLKGILLETIIEVWAGERSEMTWEGDFQLAGIGIGPHSGRSRSDGGASSSGGPRSTSGSVGGTSPLRSSGGNRRGYSRAQSGQSAYSSGETHESGRSEANFLGSDVVSMFPLVDVQLEDAVLEMPPHRMSSEALVLRFDHFRVSNEHVRASVEGMDNKIVAKVLLNSSLTQLQLRMSTLRIVSVILVERGFPSPSSATTGDLGGGGFITHSLLGSTNFTLSVDFRSRTTYHLWMNFSPVRLVCNQEQYAFLTRVPLQNYAERSRYPYLRREAEIVEASPTGDNSATMDILSNENLRRQQRSQSFGGPSSTGGRSLSRSETRVEESRRIANLRRSVTTPVSNAVLELSNAEIQGHESEEEHDGEGTGEEEERMIVFEMDIPEITMEILQGQEGYHPSDSGDLDMAEKGQSSNRGSICVLELSKYAGRVDYSLSYGRIRFDMELGGIHIRDSRTSANLSSAYRNVVVFEHQPQRQQSIGDRVATGVKALALQFSRETVAVDSSTVEIDSKAFSRTGRRASSGEQTHNPRPNTSPGNSSHLFATPRLRSSSSRATDRAFGRQTSYVDQLARGLSDSSVSVSRRSSRPDTSASSQRGSTESSEDRSDTFRQVGSEVRMELAVEVAGFRVISSNIYYDVLQFLTTASSPGDVPSDDGRIDAQGTRGRSHSHSDIEDEGDDDDEHDGFDEGVNDFVDMVEAPSFRRISIDVTLGPSIILMVEDPQKHKSRAVMLSWEATVGVDYLCQTNDPKPGKGSAVDGPRPSEAAVTIDGMSPRSASSYSTNADEVKAGTTASSKDQLKVTVAVENVHATSHMPDESPWPTDHEASEPRKLLRSYSQPTSADCLKPISLETVLQMDLSTRFVRFRSTFDRVMELRFGYLDFCTVVSALERTLRRPIPTAVSSASVSDEGTGAVSMKRRRTSSGSSISSHGSSGSLVGETSGLDSSLGRPRRRSSSTERSGSISSSRADQATTLSKSVSASSKTPPKIAAKYGSSLIYLVSATSRGRIETRPVVGFYSSTWKKRYLVLPYSAHERTQVDSVAFRILPASGSRRKIGDPVYYGDRIILEAVENPNAISEEAGSTTVSMERSATIPSEGDRSTLVSDGDGESDGGYESTSAMTPTQTSDSIICKYDQLGAIGYLGPDGSAGAFETTIWKHGSSMFNSDRSIIYDREIIVLEELTIYKSFGSGKQLFAGGQTSLDFTSARLDQQIEGAHTVGITSGARGGGYLMFNGVGDAPIPFALSIVPPPRRSRRKRRSKYPETEIDATGDSRDQQDESAAIKQPKHRHQTKHRRHRNRLAGFLMDLKVIEFTLPGVNATVINDFHNMLLPLLHFRIANLHADIRGRFDDKFTALTSLRVGVQAYNSQLAVWEPVVEDFDVNAAFHARGGVLCDYCMSERHSVSPTGAVLACDGIPRCLFRATRTEVFTSAASHAWEAKNFIYRELLEQPEDGAARDSNTFVVVINGDLNVNVSRNVINVLLHFFTLVTKVHSTAAAGNNGEESDGAARLGPFIYVDNQSGIPFLVATHPAQQPGAGNVHGGVSPSPSRRETGSGSVEIPSEVPSATDSNEELVQNETAAFHSHAWSRRRLSTLLHDISSPTTRWMRVESGQRLPTDIIAHEAPAGSVTSPLRRLLWLKPQSISRIQASSKPIPVPIGYSNRSYLHLESSSRNKSESWHGESVICETVAEQGTLVLRLRGKIQLTNYFSVPIQVVYNGERVEEIAPGARAAHYVPIQFLEQGTIAFRPVLPNGKLQRSEPIRLSSLLRSHHHRRGIFGGQSLSGPQLQQSRGYLGYHRHQRNNSKQQQPGALELRRALTFYWDELPTLTPSPINVDSEVAISSPTFNASLPPFQVILTGARKSERHETLITLRPPIQLENLIPYELSYRTVCMKSEDEVVWVEKNSASFSGSAGRVSSSSTACIAELEILEADNEDEGTVSDESASQSPTTVGLSLSIPEIGLRRFSPWSKQSIIYGGSTTRGSSFYERIELSMPENSGSNARAFAPANKLTICIEVTALDKLRSSAANALAPVVCRVFTEYWLIDRTSLSLSFYTADGFRIPSNYPAGQSGLLATSQSDQSGVSLSVYSSESTQHVSKMKIGIKTPTGREVQSDSFDISAVGVRGQILVPTSRTRESRSLLSTIAEFGNDENVSGALSRKQYEFGVMVEQGPARFSRSRVVTLVPRFYLINTSSQFDMHLRQERSGDSDILVLGPRESKVFHWADYRLPPRVQVKFVAQNAGVNGSSQSDPANSSQWSAPFELSSVGNFVLRVKANPRPAPKYLPSCFESGRGAGWIDNDTECEEKEEDEEPMFFDGGSDEEWDEERRFLLSRDIQLNVVVELHDPSFFIYLEEGNTSLPSSLVEVGGEGLTRADSEVDEPIVSEKTSFVPYRVKNECSNLELVVWQKTFTKDDRGNVIVGFEGGESVLPFHTLDYVPYRFAASPTVIVQVQQVVGVLESSGKGKRGKGSSDRSRRSKDSKLNARSSTSALIDSVSHARRVVATFEVQLKKLQRLPTIDVSDGKLKKRLWAEVLLDETSKTLLVTDMLPGVSGEHKRRRRAMLLRSWKIFNASISALSHAVTVHSQPPPLSSDKSGYTRATTDGDVSSQKKKRVRFAMDDGEDRDSQSPQETVSTPIVTPDEKPPVIVSGLALSIRLVEATGLQHLIAHDGGRSTDWSSAQPFLVFKLKSGDTETRAKLSPQQGVVFPRWLPSPSANTILSAFIRTEPLSSDSDTAAEEDLSETEVIVEIREPDKLLFSSSVVGAVRLPLSAYCAAAVRASKTTGSNHQPHVIEFLSPAVPKRTTVENNAASDGPLRAMVRFELSSQFVHKVVTDSEIAAIVPKKGAFSRGDVAENVAEPVVAATESLSYYELQKGLAALVLSKAQLKLLLEREAVDTSTGASSGQGYKSPTSTPPNSGKETQTEPAKSSDLSRLSVEDLDTSTSSQGSDSGEGSASVDITGRAESNSSRHHGSVASVTTDESVLEETYEELIDDKRLTAVLVGVNHLEIPTELLKRNAAYSSSKRYEPKVYCTITYQEATRSALSVVAKTATGSATITSSANGLSSSPMSSPSASQSIQGEVGIAESIHLERVRTHEFPRGRRPLGLDLVYQNGRVIVQGVVCDSPCGALLLEGKIRIGDTVVAVNHRSIVNLRRESSFATIQRAMFGEDESTDTEVAPTGGTFSLSFLYQPDVTSQRHFLRSSSSNVAADRQRGSRQHRDPIDVQMYDAEWNRRVEFMEEKHASKTSVEGEDPKVLVRVFLRNETSDHGLSASQESSIVPFLYFFGDDAMMDHLDHSKQDSRFDVLIAECWVPLPPTNTTAASTGGGDVSAAGEGEATAGSAFHERICALYSPLASSSARSSAQSSLDMIGQLRLALKWDFINPLTANRKREDVQLYFQLEVARICVSIVDDASTTSSSSSSGGSPSSTTNSTANLSSPSVAAGGITTRHQPREVLCISLSNQRASAGIQLSYALITDGRHVVNARVGHFQIDNQLLDTNYPVLLRPMRLVDAQLQAEGTSSSKMGDLAGGDGGDDMLLPTLQLMAVFSQQQPNVIQFEYIFGQMQELEIKLEDATLVALAQVFYGISWSTAYSAAPAKSHGTSEGLPKSTSGAFGSNLALHLLEKEWATPARMLDDSSGTEATRRGGNMKVLLRWLLLCPIKVNVTFTSTADRSVLLSLLSPDMSSALSTVIGAAAALVSNLDQAPIRVPEFYVENLLETTHTLAFYAMQHYLHHGLRSWYNIVGSVDFLGNPVGLVSTLGTGVKDFFYTPAQMLLEDEKGLRIENLRTGMTMGSKSLLRNTAVGIFHATGKITETLGKGIALLAMDEQYNAQRQRQSTRRQANKINDLGGAIAEGGRGLVGGVWDGIKGVVAAPVRGAEEAGAGGFVVGIGKGFAGLIVKPTAGFLDLLTSLSRGAKSSAEQLDGTADRDGFDGATRFRLPRRICSDGVVVSYSEREARGYAVLLLTNLDETDDYVFHVDYGMRPHRGLVMLTDKRIICLNASTGQKLWEVALDSRLDVTAEGAVLKIGQSSAGNGGTSGLGASSSSASVRTYTIECDDAVGPSNFRVAVDSARVDLSATRYLLLNLEKSQEEARNGQRNRRRRWRRDGDGDDEDDDERTELNVFMENVQDTTVTGVSADDLASQPVRSVRVELCHLLNKDAHANVPHRPIDRLLSFSVYQVQVYGGPYQWSVYRRFSEFRELWTRLEALGAPLDALPPLPTRTLLPSTRYGVAKPRQEALNIFLQAASMHSAVSRSAPLLEFLTREAQEVRVSLPPLSPSGGGGRARLATAQRSDASL